MTTGIQRPALLQVFYFRRSRSPPVHFLCIIPEGEFVLYLHNHGQKLVSEQFRSKDLDQVAEALKEKMEYRRHFNNALSNIGWDFG